METEKKLYVDIHKVFQSAENENMNVMNTVKEILNKIDLEREEMENTIQRDFLDPLTIYMRQFGVLKQRNQERDRRLIDMDRYHHDHKVGLEKGFT